MLRKIRIFTGEQTPKEKELLLFAAEELRKYLLYVTEDDVMLIEEVDGLPQKDKDGILLSTGGSDRLITTKSDEEDSILIDIRGKDGEITANNGRALLIAVYRYLREIGFAFVRPGKDGEIYPERIGEEAVFVCEKGDTKLRSVCIEGADFYGNLIDFIDWIPKIGMNSIHLQTFIPSMFFKRYYEISPNPHQEKIEMKDEDMKGVMQMLMREASRRGIILQCIGHGWTTDVFGLPSSTWLATDEEPPEDVRRHLALLNGKRAYHKKTPIATNLCYGNPPTRELLCGHVLKYCKEHPSVGIVHFWLSDAGNNFCECEKCINHTASDLYVMLLNDLDEMLTAEGLKTRICLVIYSDTLWPPIEQKIKNPDRFIMLFGPITRTYSASYPTDNKGSLCPYVRNKWTRPRDLPSLLAFVRGWQEWTGCETILYDYHYMWDHYKVFGYVDSAMRINEDIKKFKDLHFDAGFISCQEQRVFFPTAFGQHVMADTLWNTKTDFETSAARALREEFGEEYETAFSFLKEITRLSNPRVMRREENIKTEENAINYQKAIALSKEFSEVAKNCAARAHHAAHKTSWENLSIYADLSVRIFACYEAFAKGEYEDSLCESVKKFVFENEFKLRFVFDSYEFLKVFLEFICFAKTGESRAVLI